MVMKRKKPDFDNINMGVNPFESGLQIYVNKKYKKVVNKFEEKDEQEYEYEATPYTKVFDVPGDKKSVVDLPIRCKELYLYLIHSLIPAQDYLWIDKTAYMKKMGIRSINTYKEAVNGLCDAGYVSKHARLANVLWINPYHFFKGSRINKYPTKVIVKSRKEIK
jgi:hypothetical protein